MAAPERVDDGEQGFDRFEVILEIPNNWRNTQRVRASVALCVQAAFLSDEDAANVGMVSAELVENAFKYGKRSVTYTLRRGQGDLIIEVQNQGGVHEDSARLRERLDWIKSFPNAEEAYLARLQAVASESKEGESGVGLVRIAFQGKCSLECSEPEPGRVLVRARYPLGADVST